MHLSDIIRFYSNKEVKEHILALSKNREVVVRYNDRVGSRPDTLLFEADIEQVLKKGATSFHASMERWKNPLLLKQMSTKKEMDSIRIGWDLILDIDCKHLAYSKISAVLLCEALEFHGIKNYSVKFSGNTGFHIGVPFESFPEEINEKPISSQFPDGARVIAEYLKEMIKAQLSERILDFEEIKEVCKRTGKEFKEIVKDGEFDPYTVLDIDTIAISQRHLFRLPYTFNEKSWLISVPIKKEDIEGFKLNQAEYRNVKPKLGFLDKFEKDEARQLFIQAFDWNLGKTKEYREIAEKFEIPKQAVQKKFFPPCVLKILEGVQDGRKRAVFILVNFLKSTGWDWDSIEKEIFDWNQRNDEPLRESYIKSQINWHKRLKDSYIPPSCDNKNYYKDIKVCNPDNFCTNVKNPVVYPFKKMKKQKK